MARTPSNMVALGTKAPLFELLEPKTNKKLSLADLQSPIATVVVFMCNHCPYVIHIAKTLGAVAQRYQEKGMQFIGINANDVDHYPDDAPDKMVNFAANYNLLFPYLFDETQATAKAYQAACTPDFYVFDQDLKLVYRGQFDDARPSNEIPVTGNDLTHALDAILMGNPINPEQKPSLGCNIKWK